MKFQKRSKRRQSTLTLARNGKNGSKWQKNGIKMIKKDQKQKIGQMQNLNTKAPNEMDPKKLHLGKKRLWKIKVTWEFLGLFFSSLLCSQL